MGEPQFTKKAFVGRLSRMLKRMLTERKKRRKKGDAEGDAVNSDDDEGGGPMPEAEPTATLRTFRTGALLGYKKRGWASDVFFGQNLVHFAPGASVRATVPSARATVSSRQATSTEGSARGSREQDSGKCRGQPRPYRSSSG